MRETPLQLLVFGAAMLPLLRLRLLDIVEEKVVVWRRRASAAEDEDDNRT